ncbi:MAG: hypothetical protein V1754_01440 [Pseudomonadota bacterium]
MRSFAEVTAYVQSKKLGKWVGGYIHDRFSRMFAPSVPGTRHLIFAICDHYEPLWGGAPETVGQKRVGDWLEQYPKLANEFRDADGHHPRHSFFFPAEQYSPWFLDRLGELAKGGYGEVELHLHHDGDTADKLRADLLSYLDMYAQHGHLTRDENGRKRYAFVHGNWCLSNARKDGRWCGVNEELTVLFDTGCYADFTFPSAPDETQPNIVNRIYWPVGDLSKRGAYKTGKRAHVGEVKKDRILIIQGPLALSWCKRKIPIRIENADLTGKNPGTKSRAKVWVDQNIHVVGRPEWVFVKVHTHGAPEKNSISLLGEGGCDLHRVLTRGYNDGERWVLHYVTAREMYNIAVAAMSGESGNPNEYRDYVLSPPPIAR